MKIAEKCKVVVAGAIVAALMAGTALPALAASPAGDVPFAVLAQQNSAATPEQVEALISQIAPVTLESKTAINNAQAAFDSMPTKWQEMVSNYDKLKQYQEELEDLQVDALAEKLNNTVYREHDEVENVDYYFWSGYPKTDQYTFVMPYFCGRGGDIQPLRMLYIYYEKNWIFYNQIIYNVDGDIYYRPISKDNISRKTVTDVFGNGVYVWEYGDVVADSEEIRLMKKALTAQSVTIRFKGDNALADFHMDIHSRHLASISGIFDAYESLQAASPTVRARALARMESHKQGTKFVRLAF